MEDLLNKNLMKKAGDQSFEILEKYKDDSIRDNLSSKSEVTTNSITSYFTVSNAQVVTCKMHGQNYIGVQTSKFRLVCKKCIELGLKGNDFEVVSNGENLHSEEDDIACRDHHNSKGSFYCNDCNYFICKFCFSDTHRNHNSNLPNYMANKYKENLKNFIIDIIRLKPEIEEGLETILKLNEEIKSIRETTQSNLSKTLENISQENKKKTEKLDKNFVTQIYQGIDEEVDATSSRLAGIYKKITKYITEVSDMINNVKNRTNPIEICNYRKFKNNSIKDIEKLFIDSQNLLEFKYTSVVKSAKEKIESIDKSVKSYNKQVSIYEKSVVNSILSGITNKSIVLRRFNKYRKRKELICFKSSSLLMKVDNPIFLTGFGLCGLYISSQTLHQSDGKLFSNVSDRIKIPILIKISELIDQNEVEEKVSDEQTLFGVLDRNDPTYQIYLKRAVFLKSNTNYLISIQNLDKNIYVDIWSGKVGEIFIKEMKQNLKCNCSNVNFNFSCANGFESDFDEFNFGIIGNIFYSHIG